MKIPTPHLLLILFCCWAPPRPACLPKPQAFRRGLQGRAQLLPFISSWSTSWSQRNRELLLKVSLLLSLSSSLSSPGDDTEPPKTRTRAVHWPFHWNLIRTHRPAVWVVAIRELKTFWNDHFAFLSIANNF